MSAVLRLKMSVSSVKSVADGNGEKASEELTFQAVYGSAGSSNEQWSKWTPAAHLSMTISNPGAFDKLRTGQFVFVDITPTDKDAI